jgi:predicted nucleic acid-binding protein
MEIIQIVVDANIITKWFIEEKDSDKANIIKEKYINGEIEILVSPLLYFEVLNALNYSNLFDKTEINSAGESLENYGFTIINIQKEIRKQMIHIAFNHDLSIYDASYLALGLENNCILYTADNRIIQKLPNRLKQQVKKLSAFTLKGK